MFYWINRRRDPECPCDREKLDKDKVCLRGQFSAIILYFNVM